MNLKCSQEFHIACLLITVGSIIYFLVDFYHDENTALVDFKTFHENEKDIYPSVTIGFLGQDIFDAKKLNETYGIESAEDYPKFLKGEIWDENFLKANYDDVTLNLTDFVNFWVKQFSQVCSLKKQTLGPSCSTCLF